MPGEVLKISKRYSQPNLSYWRKTNRGGGALSAPPSGRGLKRINSIRETNGNFDSYNSCKLLETSHLQELHESKFPFVSRIEFIRSKLSNCSARLSGVIVSCHSRGSGIESFAEEISGLSVAS